MSYYQSNMGRPFPPVTKALVIANVGAFLLTILFQKTGIIPYLAVSSAGVLEHHYLWQLVTYGFIHSPTDILHILFNMLILWMFGGELEAAWGSGRFLRFYFFSLIGGGIFALFSSSLVIGASGAVMAIMLGYAMMWPNREILFMFVIPVKIKWMVLGILIFTIAMMVGSSGSSTSHHAHLGGLVFGFLYLYRIVLMNKGQASFNTSASSPSLADRLEESRRRRRLKKKQQVINTRIEIQEKVDELLEKISKHGMNSLSRAEKKFLNKASQELNRNEFDQH